MKKKVGLSFNHFIYNSIPSYFFVNMVSKWVLHGIHMVVTKSWRGKMQSLELKTCAFQRVYYPYKFVHILIMNIIISTIIIIIIIKLIIVLGISLVHPRKVEEFVAAILRIVCAVCAVCPLCKDNWQCRRYVKVFSSCSITLKITCML